MFEREANEPVKPQGLDMRIVLNDQELYRGGIEADFQGKLEFQWISDVRGLVIPFPGVLRFVIIFENQEMGEWRLPVVDISQPTVQTELPLTQEAIGPLAGD